MYNRTSDKYVGRSVGHTNVKTALHWRFQRLSLCLSQFHLSCPPTVHSSPQIIFIQSYLICFPNLFLTSFPSQRGAHIGFVSNFSQKNIHKKKNKNKNKNLFLRNQLFKRGDKLQVRSRCHVIFPAHILKEQFVCFQSFGMLLHEDVRIRLAIFVADVQLFLEGIDVGHGDFV